MMANHKLPPTETSKRQVMLEFGFNFRHLENLIEAGILDAPKYGITLSSVSRLKEGEHFVVCEECGARQSAITSKHLRSCSDLTLKAYRTKYGETSLACSFTEARRAKTEEERAHQSRILKERFQTPEGEVTRKQISEAAKRMQASGYRKKAAAHLRKINRDPEMRKARGKEAKARWDSGEMRELVAKWHQDNREASLKSAQYARRHIKRKFSKLHKQVKAALIEADLVEFCTEYEIGYFSIDEALPRLKLAVEVDGCYWHGCDICNFPGVGKILTYDARKTTFLENRGWHILRLREHEIKADMDACLQRVRQEIQRLEKV